MKLAPRARAMVGVDDIRWYGIKIEHRDIVKRLPRTNRWWSPTLRAWITPVFAIATLPVWLEDAGYEVVIVDVSHMPDPRDWHAVYREVFGHPCKHKQKQAADRFAANEIQELGAAA